MRKVKLLALLLAALMVVTAFAGCANTKEIESDVANLDERVSALEGKIDDVKDAIEDSNSDEELKAIQDALTKQEAANQALLEQLQKLQEELNKTNTKVEDLPTADEGLAQAQKDAAADIAARKAVYENNKADYTTKDYEAILTILEVAKTGVAAATKSADVKAIVAQMDTDLAKYTAYDDQLYIYVTKLLGNISTGSKDLNKEAQEYLEKAEEHYDDNDTATKDDLKPLKNYVYDEDENGDDLTIDLVDTLARINALQTSTAKATGYSTSDYAVDITIGDVTTTYVTLYRVTEWAKSIDKAYNKLDGKEIGEIISENKAGPIYADYEKWLVAANALGAENVSLVTKATELAELAKMVENIAEAKNAYKKLGDVDYSTGGTYKDVLTPYVNLTVKDLIDVNDKAIKKTVYDVIDKKIADWQKTYGFDDEFAAAVIAQYYKEDNDAATASDLYDEYTQDRDYVNYMEQAYTSFVKNIVPAIKNVNATKLPLTSTSVAAYVELEAALADWRIVVEADAEKDIEEVAVDDVNFGLMLKRQDLLPDKITTVTKNETFFKSGDAVMTNIVEFENDVDDETTATAGDKVIANFFAKTYGEAKAYAKDLRKAFKTLNDGVAKKTSLYAVMQLEGEYGYVSGIKDVVVEGVTDAAATNERKAEYADYVGKYVVISDWEDEDVFVYDTTLSFYKTSGKVRTIAEFEELYSQYGLMSLLDNITPYATNEKPLATFESVKAKLETLVSGAKNGYAEVVKAVEKIDYQKAWINPKYTTSNTKYMYSPVEIAGATVAYLVNLDDKDTVEAAVAARTNWKTAYRAGLVQDFVTATKVVDGKTVEISGAYTFESIADSDVDAILDQVSTRMSALVTEANNLIAHLNNLSSALAFFAKNEGYNIASTDSSDYDLYAVTEILSYYDEHATQNYRVKTLAADANGLATVVKAYEGIKNPENAYKLKNELGAVVKGTSLKTLIDNGYTYYANFCKQDGKEVNGGLACNVSYKDTTELNGSTEVRYYKMSQKTYAPVEEAKLAVSELDVAYAQARAIGALDSAIASIETLKTEVETCKAAMEALNTEAVQNGTASAEEAKAYADAVAAYEAADEEYKETAAKIEKLVAKYDSYVALAKAATVKDEFVALYDLCKQETGVTLQSFKMYSSTVQVTSFAK